MPYLCGFESFAITYRKIHTKGALEAAKRELREKAMHSFLLLICMGLDQMKLFDAETIHRVFLNANITWGEIQTGYTTLEELEKIVRDKGIIVRETSDDMELLPADEVQDA